MLNPEIKEHTEDTGAGSDCRVLHTRVGAMVYLAPVDAELNEEMLSILHESINSCIEDRDNQVVLDLVNVPLLNSHFLNEILVSEELLIRSGGWLKLANLNPINRDILDISGVSEYVPVLDPPDEISANVIMPNAGSKPGRLGDELVARGLITADMLNKALAQQDKLGKRVGHILVDKGWLQEKDLLLVLGDQLQVPYVRLNPKLTDTSILQDVGKEKALRLGVLPLFKVKNVISLATSNPQSILLIDEIEEATGCKVRTILASHEDILKTANDVYSSTDYSVDAIETVDEDFHVIENLLPDDYSVIDEMAEGSPIINLVNSIIQRAIRDSASDVHIEPSRNMCRIRTRIDGVLYEISMLNPELHPSIVSRLKVMANLDIAERRLPQDGRIQVHTRGREVDLRFSSLPGLFGEKIVLRVLDKNQSLLDLNNLGMAEHNLASYKSILGRSFGLILATGPTGSGKTTSLYAAINHLNSIEKNIVTIEDPVEYQMEIINQNEVRENIGLTFNKVLKHVLRQDPDIIMVGEIRDSKTAEIAVQAALTGHLVLSTLHTNHAIGAITRMIDMGVEPYLLSSALIGVLGQRLVRTVCPSCKTEFIAPPELVERYGWSKSESIRLSKGRGCGECYDSGYKGRIGIHEILVADDQLQNLITSNPARDELEKYLSDSKHHSLFDDGLSRAREGKTTIEEISRVINL